MPVTRQKKEKILAQVTDNFAKAKTIVFSQYKGTNVKNMRELRKKLLEKKVAFKVAKKTLIKIAAGKSGFSEIPASFLEGPVGLAFAMEDEMAAAKILHEFGKTAETIKIAGAIFEGKFIDAAQTTALAILPGREVLLARFVGLLKSPISSFHGVLYSLMRNFVFALSEISKKKSAA